MKSVRRRDLLLLLAGGLGGGLAGASGLSLAAGAIAPAIPKRIAVLDWGLTEVVLSLGVTPVGISRPPWYSALDGQPSLPSSVIDTGLLFQPNFEVLQSLALDLIVVTPWHESLRSHLERIAPVLSVPMFASGGDTYALVRAATMQLAAALDRMPQAQAVLARADRQMADATRQLADLPSRIGSVYLLRPIDAAHFTVYGAHSLFGGVLHALGIDNAWQGATDAQGSAQIDITALASRPDARIVTLGMPSSLATQLAHSPLWQVLPQASLARQLSLPAFPAFGGLVTASRFAATLVAALQPVGGARLTSTSPPLAMRRMSGVTA